MEKSSASFVLILLVFFLFASIGSSKHVGAQSFSITTISDNANNSNYELESETVSYYGDALGYLVSPTSNDTITNTTGSTGEQQQKLPAVVMIHEWWGLNDNIKNAADDLANEGYVVLAVDLYNGEVAADPNRARELSSSVGNNPEQAIANLQSAVSYLGSLENVNSSRIASLGWCFGGGQSLQLALNSEDQPLAATVIYYGQVINDIDALSTINWPVLGIFGDQDQSIPVESVNAFERALNETGIINEIYIYQGVGHAFANPSGDNYAPEETANAWQKTLAFLDKHVSAKNNSGIEIQEAPPHTVINNETQVLVNDVIKDLQVNDTNSAVIHLKLVQQQLSHIAENSSAAELAKILVNDTLEDLDKADIGSAMVHMNLASQQLATETTTHNQTSFPDDIEKLTAADEATTETVSVISNASDITIGPTNVGNRQASLFVKADAPILTLEGIRKEGQFLFRLFDPTNNQTIKFVTYEIEIREANTQNVTKPILRDFFHAPNGLLVIRVDPTESGPLQVFRDRDPFQNALIADPNGIVNTRGPILTDNGLYDIQVKIFGIENIRNIFLPENAPKFEVMMPINQIATLNNTYNLAVGNKTFPIRYQINNASLNNITVKTDQASLLLDIDQNDDGTLAIDIPRQVIDSKGPTNADEEFTVFADGQQTIAEETTKNNSQSRTLGINFENGVEQLEIVGTQIAASPPATEVIQTNETAAVEQATLSQLEENKTQSQSQSVDFLTFDSIAPDLKIKYPSDWVTGGPNVSEPITIINSFYSPESEDFAQVIVGVDYTYRAHSKLNDFLSDAVSSYSMYPEYFPAFKLDYSSTDNATLAGERAYMLEGRYNDSELGIQKVMEVGTIIGNKGYFVQYFASPAIYSHYLTTVQTMLDSVQIIPSLAAQPKMAEEQEIPSETPLDQEPMQPDTQTTVVTVHLDTHWYTIRDQPVKVRVWNAEETDYKWSTLTMPSSGGSTSFTVTNDFIPEGRTFTVCVSNERNNLEDCKQVVREYGSSQTNVYLTVP